MKTKLYNLKGEVVGDVELSDSVFAREWNPDLVHQVVTAQAANLRKPWAHAKGRGEVRGGGIKPWKQKGTGRARQGSIRSPLWVGGGVSHGPTKERDYSQKINSKMRLAALHSALSKKLSEGEVRVVDSLVVEQPKTKIAVTALRQFFGGSDAKKMLRLNALLIPASENKSIYRTVRNIPKVKSLNAKALNVSDVLKYKNILIDKQALVDIK